MGGRSIFGFFALLTGYETATTEVSAFAASEMYMMFLLFLVCIIGGIVMSCLSKAKVSRTFFLIRNTVLIVAEGLMIILACVTVYKYIVDKKKNSNYNNMYM